MIWQFTQALGSVLKYERPSAYPKVNPPMPSRVSALRPWWSLRSAQVGASKTHNTADQVYSFLSVSPTVRDELRFGPLATTRMAGPESAMQREAAFLAALERVTSYALDGRTLTFSADDDVIARLSC